jgi:HAD superfamily hydrolase (TIGR01509 family)
MIKVLLFDFSRVLLHPIDKTYFGSLNSLHKQLKDNESFYVFHYFELNEQILEYLETIKGKLRLAIFTTDIIQDDPLIKERIDPLFEKIYSASKLGITKKTNESYDFLAKDLNVKPEEILFIDDTESNIIPANEAGFKTHHYKNNGELLKFLKSI